MVNYDVTPDYMELENVKKALTSHKSLHCHCHSVDLPVQNIM